MRVSPTCFASPSTVMSNPPPSASGNSVLRDLIALRQVWVEVVLAREDGARLDIAAARERGLDREVDGLTIENGKRPRQSQTYRTDLGIWRRAKLGAASAKDFRTRLQLCVDFEADYGFPVAHERTLLEGRARALHRGRHVVLEGDEVVDEHLRKLLRLLVVLRRIRPRASRIEHRVGHTGA